MTTEQPAANVTHRIYVRGGPTAVSDAVSEQRELGDELSDLESIICGVIDDSSALLGQSEPDSSGPDREHEIYLQQNLQRLLGGSANVTARTRADEPTSGHAAEDGVIAEPKPQRTRQPNARPESRDLLTSMREAAVSNTRCAIGYHDAGRLLRDISGSALVAAVSGSLSLYCLTGDTAGTIAWRTTAWVAAVVATGAFWRFHGKCNRGIGIVEHCRDGAPQVHSVSGAEMN